MTEGNRNEKKLSLPTVAKRVMVPTQRNLQSAFAGLQEAGCSREQDRFLIAKAACKHPKTTREKDTAQSRGFGTASVAR